jgi:hypothetical protein
MLGKNYAGIFFNHAFLYVDFVVRAAAVLKVELGFFGNVVAGTVFGSAEGASAFGAESAHTPGTFDGYPMCPTMTALERVRDLLAIDDDVSRWFLYELWLAVHVIPSSGR